MSDPSLQSSSSLEKLLGQPVTTSRELKACVDAWEKVDCLDCASRQEKEAYFALALALATHAQALPGIEAGERDTILLRLLEAIFKVKQEQWTLIGNRYSGVRVPALRTAVALIWLLSQGGYLRGKSSSDIPRKMEEMAKAVEGSNADNDACVKYWSTVLQAGAVVMRDDGLAGVVKELARSTASSAVGAFSSSALTTIGTDVSMFLTAVVADPLSFGTISLLLTGVKQGNKLWKKVYEKQSAQTWFGALLGPAVLNNMTLDHIKNQITNSTGDHLFESKSKEWIGVAAAQTKNMGLMKWLLQNRETVGDDCLHLTLATLTDMQLDESEIDALRSFVVELLPTAPSSTVYIPDEERRLLELRARVEVLGRQQRDGSELSTAKIVKLLRSNLDAANTYVNPDIESKLQIVEADGFLQDKAEGFVGRAGLFQRVHDWRVNGKLLLDDGVVSHDDPAIVIISGEPGIGKSSFLSALVRLPAHSDSVIAFHFCQYNLEVSMIPQRWLENMTVQLLRWGATRGLGDEDRMSLVEMILKDTPSVQEKWSRLLRKLKDSVKHSGDRVLVVIDSLDEALDVGPDKGGVILQALAAGSKECPTWLRILTTSRHDEEVMEVVQSHLHGVVSLSSDQKENQESLEEYVKGKCRDSEKVEQILRTANGNFLFVVELLKDPELDKMLREDQVPRSLFELYSRTTRRLFSTRENFEEALPVFSVLLAAKAPVPGDVFDGAMEFLNVSELARSVLEWYKSVIVSGCGIVKVYHKSFGDWLQREGWSIPGQGKRRMIVRQQELLVGHDALASACAGLWAAEKWSYANSFLFSHAVAGTGRIEVLDRVIEAIRGVDVEAGEWYSYQSGHDKLPVFSRSRRTLLWMAASAGRLDIVLLLLERFNSNPAIGDGMCSTSLSIAAEKGHVKVVAALLNCRPQLAKDRNKAGQTALWRACREGHSAVVEELVKHSLQRMGSSRNQSVRSPQMLILPGKVVIDSGTEPTPETKVLDLPSNGFNETPLFVACERGFAAVVRILVGSGADPSISDSNGRTPLHAASTAGHVDVVRELINAGANKTMEDDGGRTPQDVAVNDTVRALLQAS